MTPSEKQAALDVLMLGLSAVAYTCSLCLAIVRYEWCWGVTAGIWLFVVAMRSINMAVGKAGGEE